MITFGHQNDEQKPPATTGDKLFKFDGTDPSLWFTDDETSPQDKVCYYLALINYVLLLVYMSWCLLTRTQKWRTGAIMILVASH